MIKSLAGKFIGSKLLCSLGCGESFSEPSELKPRVEVAMQSTQVATQQLKSSRLSRLKSRRKLWLSVHLWLGLTAGMILMIAGLTGSVLAFWQEIDAWLNPNLHLVQVPEQGRTAYRTLSDIVATADAAMPANATRSTIYYPRSEDLAFWFFYEVPSAQSDRIETLNVWIDPYTATVTGTRVWTSAENIFKHCLIAFIFELHYDLLLGWDDGSWIVGVVAILAFISVSTGLIVWWPLTGKWRQALTIKRGAGVERINFDVHKTFGFYSCIVLFAVLISGIYFNFGKQFRWLVDQFSATVPIASITSKPLPGADPITPDQAMQRIATDYPEGRLYWFLVPGNQEGTYIFTKHIDFGGIFRGRRQIVLDQYTGHVLHVADPLAGDSGNVLMQWLWPMHSGQAMRMLGRILVLLTGIVCAVLFVTGFIRWRQKQRAQSKHQQRRRKN
jgi:uncharacterized iron-regulated membrane protein